MFDYQQVDEDIAKLDHIIRLAEECKEVLCYTGSLGECHLHYGEPINARLKSVATWLQNIRRILEGSFELAAQEHERQMSLQEYEGGAEPSIACKAAQAYWARCKEAQNAPDRKEPWPGQTEWNK